MGEWKHLNIEEHQELAGAPFSNRLVVLKRGDGLLTTSWWLLSRRESIEFHSEPPVLGRKLPLGSLLDSRDSIVLDLDSRNS